MLKRLVLRNFQAHRKRTIEFDRQITTIVGPTDSGKTAILRALRWAFFNRPQGARFKTRGADFVRVTADIDKHTITRSKGKKNAYKLNGRVLLAFKSSVPDPIKEVLNLSDINFQQQHDPVFWLSSTPGEVSKELNRIVSLDIIDLTLANLASELRKANATVEVSKERLDNAEAEKKSLKWVKQYHKEVKALAESESKLERLSGRIENLTTLLAAIRRSSSLIRKLPALDSIDTLARQTSSLERKEEALALLLASIKNQDQRIASFRSELGKLEGQFNKEMRVCPLCGKPTK